MRPKDAVCQISEPVHKKILKYSPNFTLFLRLIGPQYVPVPCFLQMWIPLPKYASYQSWFKSVQWLWRKSPLKEKFTDRRQTDGWDMITIAHLSIWPLAQVS